jgi:PPOX class probable F420-dependent enzyme
MTTDADRGRSLTDPMRKLLEEQQILTLATQNPDGSAHVVPVLYQFSDGRFVAATSSNSRKARNIAERPDVTVLVEDREATAWVSAVGVAELRHGPAAREINDRLERMWLTDRGLEAIGSLVAKAEDTTIVVTPSRWLAWDFTSDFLNPLADAGIPLDDAEGWFKT